MEFQYLAYTSHGREERGSVAAENAARAFVILRRRDLHPVKLERSPWPALGRSMSMFKVSKITLQELGEICREISLLLSASLPINTALAATSQKRSGASGAMLRRVEVAVEQGIPLGQALERESTLPEMLWQTVRAAEMGSALPRVLPSWRIFFSTNNGKDRKRKLLCFTLKFSSPSQRSFRFSF